jgi:hypothetical protein
MENNLEFDPGLRLFYRVFNIETEQGLWYNTNGVFTGLIHTKFNFCLNTKLPMPYDEEIRGWLSATPSLTDLFNWFTVSDIEKLEEHGYYVHSYLASKYRTHANHWVIDQKTSILSEQLPIKLIMSTIKE